MPSKEHTPTHCSPTWNIFKSYSDWTISLSVISSEPGTNILIIKYSMTLEIDCKPKSMPEHMAHLYTSSFLSGAGLGQGEYCSMLYLCSRAFLSVARIITGHSRQHWSHTVQIVALSEVVSLHQHQTCLSGKTAVSKWCLHSRIWCLCLVIYPVQRAYFPHQGPEGMIYCLMIHCLRDANNFMCHLWKDWIVSGKTVYFLFWWSTSWLFWRQISSVMQKKKTPSN